MNTCRNTRWVHDRRSFLQQTAAGFGWLALSCIARPGIGCQSAGAEAAALRAARKRVIFLFMNGGPSHLDTFDWKPELARAGSAARRGKYLAAGVRLPARGQERADDLRGLPASGEAGRRAVPAQRHADEQSRASSGRRRACTPAARTSSAPRSAPGSSTAWARWPRTCPASSRSTRSRDLGGAHELRLRVSAGHVPGHAAGRRPGRRARTSPTGISPTATSGGSSISSSGPIAGCWTATPAIPSWKA